MDLHLKLYCKEDEDCNAGHECVGEGDQRRCLDIDECSDPRWAVVLMLLVMVVTVSRFSAATLAICGSNTACSNSHGSYSCPCNTGYEGWVAGQVGAPVQHVSSNTCPVCRAAQTLTSVPTPPGTTTSARTARPTLTASTRCLCAYH